VDEFLYEGSLAICHGRRIEAHGQRAGDAPGGTTVSKVEETTIALRELGLPEDVDVMRK